MKKFPDWSRKLMIILFWVLVWQAATMIIRNRIFLVGPLDTMRALTVQIAAPSFWKAVGFSFGRISLGFFSAFGVGLVTGAAACRFRFLGELLAAPIQMMKSIPVASFVILALIWTGSENLSVFITFVVVYPMIHLATAAGLESTDRKLLEAAKVFGVPLWKKAVYLFRPALYPYLQTACRTALGMGFKSGIAAEVIGVPDGSIGEGLYMAKIYLSTAELFSWTLAIILVSMGFERLVLFALKQAAAWGEAKETASGELGTAAAWKEADQAKEADQDDQAPREPKRQGMDILIEHLSKSYGEQKVLSDLNLTFPEGTISCLTAPSGAGKTTLFRILMGLEKADSGRVLGLENQRIGAVFQEDRLLEAYSAIQNLRFVTGSRYKNEELMHTAERLLPAGSLQKPVRTFSGGMKRRAAILRALLAPSDVILMDEPFTGLDEGTKGRAIEIIKEFSGDKILIIVTHGPEDAGLLGARIVRL